MSRCVVPTVISNITFFLQQIYETAKVGEIFVISSKVNK